MPLHKSQKVRPPNSLQIPESRKSFLFFVGGGGKMTEITANIVCDLIFNMGILLDLTCLSKTHGF